jgi:hypothetical protein
MALIISIRLVGQMLSSDGGFVGWRFHVGWLIRAIWGGFGCHSAVGLSIEADGCPEAGDFACHSGVWTFRPSRLMVALRLGTWCATWV